MSAMTPDHEDSRPASVPQPPIFVPPESETRPEFPKGGDAAIYPQPNIDPNVQPGIQVPANSIEDAAGTTAETRPEADKELAVNISTLLRRYFGKPLANPAWNNCEADPVSNVILPLIRAHVAAETAGLRALILAKDEALESLPELYNLATEKSCTCYSANDCAFCSAWEKADSAASTAIALTPSDWSDCVFVKRSEWERLNCIGEMQKNP